MRSMWKGAISFGLVYIPVRLYLAARPRALEFHLLHKKDHSEIRYARICKRDGKEVSWSEVEKGYRLGDKYIVLSDEDFERASAKKTKTIEILKFTNLSAIDPLYFETPYFLEPEKEAGPAYNLLREAIQKSGKVALAKFVFKNHEHIGAIHVHERVLVLNQMRYAGEIATLRELELPEEKKVSKPELDMALEFIEQLTQPFRPSAYKDTYVEEMKEIIAKKAKGKKIKARKEKAPRLEKVQDIMTLLKESMKKRRKAA